jgi:hypothetical protein
MATVRIDGTTLHVDLSHIDKVLALHGSFAIPLANITGVSTTKPPGYWSSIKLLGTDLPWGKMAGSFLHHDEMVFFDYRGTEATVLVIDLSESRYRHLFIHVDEPDTPTAAAERILAAMSAS